MDISCLGKSLCTDKKSVTYCKGEAPEAIEQPETASVVRDVREEVSAPADNREIFSTAWGIMFGCMDRNGRRIIPGRREARWTGKVELIEGKVLEPLSWRKKAAKFRAKHGRQPRCFVNSMSDMFHAALADDAIDRVFASMALCPEIDFLVLTKRADRMAQYFSDAAYRAEVVGISAEQMSGTDRFLRGDEVERITGCADDIIPRWPLPLPNVWLGVSVEDQRRADERIPHLLRTPAAVRFLSCEPLLGPIDLFAVPRPDDAYFRQRGETGVIGPKSEPDDYVYWQKKLLHWVITGAESGPSARPCQEDWTRSLRDQCQAAGTAFFYKQAIIGGKKVETPELDGQRWMQFPEVRP